MSNSQPLCKAGICNTNSTQKNNVDPTTKTLTQTFTNMKIPTLSRTFTGTRTLGPDTFRFINSFWTSPPINNVYKFPSNAVGTGNCPSNFGDFTAAAILDKFLSTPNGTSSLAAARAFPWLPLTTADPNVEVGHDDIAVLAILLQYQGNVKVHQAILV